MACSSLLAPGTCVVKGNGCASASMVTSSAGRMRAPNKHFLSMIFASPSLPFVNTRPSGERFRGVPAACSISSKSKKGARPGLEAGLRRATLVVWRRLPSTSYLEQADLGVS